MTITATDKPNFITGSSLQGAFYQCTDLVVSGSTAETQFANWDTDPVEDFSSCFYQCLNFNESLNSWNVTSGANFSSMFEGASSFNNSITWGGGFKTGGTNINMSRMFTDSGFNNNTISNWNMNNVTNTSHMFSGASNFNVAINSWGDNTKNITQMEGMFKNTSSFNQNLNNWNTGKVVNMQEMFSGSNTFNKDISNWNVSKVTNMSSMFNGASSFNNGGATGTTSNPLDWTNSDGGSNWSLSTTSNMFNGASNFNQTLSIDSDGVGDFGGMFTGAASFNNGGNDFSTSTLSTGSAYNMNNMFKNATSFTGGGVGTFDTSGVTSMQSTFEGATNFNEDIGGWNTGSTTNMTNLLADATNFNQDISNWNVEQVTESEGILENTNLDPSNAESINDGWSAQPGVDPSLVEEVEEAEEAAAPTAPSYSSKHGDVQTVSVAENNTGIVDLAASSFWAPDNTSVLTAEGSTIKYVLEAHPNAAADLDKFKLTNTSITENPDLQFKTAPDYENPTDTSYGGTNTYYVRVKAYVDGADGGYASYSG
jgi:surface protein